VDGLPEADQRDAEQNRGNDKESRGFEGVDMVVSMPVVELRLLLRRGGHVGIVAPPVNQG
jgi:hypothetical protein